MYLISSLLFGISASLDALLVGFSCGFRGIRIRAWQNICISFTALMGTCLSAFLGARLLRLLPHILSDCLGSLTLMLLGIYYLAKWLFSRAGHTRSDCGAEAEPTEFSFHKSQPGLSIPEICFLSITLSANNICIGLSASMAGLPALPAGAATFACSFCFLFSGNYMGRSHFLRLVGRVADPISGLLLIGLGFIQLFTK